jgi:serine/threonine protein kinase
MSPETMLHTISNETSKKTDVYSFGVIMYEVFFEKVPYADHRIDSIISFSNKIINGLRPTLPEDMESYTEAEQKYLELMQQCWSETTQARPSFDHIFGVFMDILN